MNDKDTNFYLLKTMEESSEITQIASKCIQFGLNEVYANGKGLSNQERLLIEFHDLVACLEVVLGCPVNKFLDRDKINDKIIKINKYRNYSLSLNKGKSIFNE